MQDSAGGLGVHTGTSHWQPDEASPPTVTRCVGNQPDGLMCGDWAIERRNPCRVQPGRQIDFSTSCHYDLKINHSGGVQNQEPCPEHKHSNSSLFHDASTSISTT